MAKQQDKPAREEVGKTYVGRRSGPAPGAWTVSEVTLYSDGTYEAKVLEQGRPRAVARERLLVLFDRALP